MSVGPIAAALIGAGGALVGGGITAGSNLAVERTRAKRAAEAQERSDQRELRAYPGWVVARVARWAFLNAMRPLESCRRARWFSSFLDQRMSIPRLRFSQEWQASTTQRRAFHSGFCAFSSISSPRARMCGVSA